MGVAEAVLLRRRYAVKKKRGTRPPPMNRRRAVSLPSPEPGWQGEASQSRRAARRPVSQARGRLYGLVARQTIIQRQRVGASQRRIRGAKKSTLDIAPCRTPPATKGFPMPPSRRGRASSARWARPRGAEQRPPFMNPATFACRARIATRRGGSPRDRARAQSTHARTHAQSAPRAAATNAASQVRRDVRCFT